MDEWSIDYTWKGALEMMLGNGLSLIEINGYGFDQKLIADYEVMYVRQRFDFHKSNERGGSVFQTYNKEAITSVAFDHKGRDLVFVIELKNKLTITAYVNKD